jgi:hypothetical protein
MYNMVLYYCVLIVFSLRRESLKLILATDPSRGGSITILIRLPMLADHGRTCAACAAFHHIITSPAFLRGLHLHRVFRAGRAALPVARALVRAANFRFSFLPNPTVWVVRDARDGHFVVDCDERVMAPSPPLQSATPCSGAMCFFLKSLKIWPPPSRTHTSSNVAS